MSLESWKKEFYPVEASEIESLEEMHRLTLLKWEGLRKENLKKHGLIKRGARLFEQFGDSYFPVSDATCAYCKKFFLRVEYLRHPGSHYVCSTCPLAKAANAANDNIGCHAEFDAFYSNSDPEPMIELIKKAIEDYNKGK